MTDPPHQDAARHPSPRRRSNRDLFAALASGFVGALALASSIYNVYLQRQQLRAQVLPRLEWGVHWGGGKPWTLDVSNRGVGPADVKRIRVFVDGNPASNWLEVERGLFLRGKPSIGVVGNVVTTISPGQSVSAFSLAEEDLAREMFAERKRLGMELCYCSTLEDCWLVAGHGLASDITTPVASCDRDPTPFAMFDEKVLDDYVRSLEEEAPDASVRDARAD